MGFNKIRRNETGNRDNNSIKREGSGKKLTYPASLAKCMKLIKRTYSRQNSDDDMPSDVTSDGTSTIKVDSDDENVCDYTRLTTFVLTQRFIGWKV